MMYFAHSTDRPDRSDWQPLAEHLRGVGAGAAERAGRFGVSQAALLAGLGHDLGKYSLAFDRRLSGSPERVDHSTAGAREVMSAAEGRSGAERGMAELVAYAIAGHHAGLPDRNGGPASLAERLHGAAIPPLDPVWRSEIALGSPGGLAAGFTPHGDKSRRAFQLAFLGRMIFSTLIDADRRNTQCFSDGIAGTVSDHEWSRLPDIADGLVARLDRHLAGMGGGGGETDLNRLRATVLAHVTGRAEDSRGLYTLTVPTGGGKTLTVTRFALGHARRWGLDRIVYAIPFTGARIETATTWTSGRRPRSPPHGGADRNTGDQGGQLVPGRRPLTGARIETWSMMGATSPGRSPPHGGADRNSGAMNTGRPFVVAPSRGRGSKHRPTIQNGLRLCRPLTGARIETGSLLMSAPLLTGRPLTGARIETLAATRRSPRPGGRPLTGARIETSAASGPG